MKNSHQLIQTAKQEIAMEVDNVFDLVRMMHDKVQEMGIEILTEDDFNINAFDRYKTMLDRVDEEPDSLYSGLINQIRLLHRVVGNQLKEDHEEIKSTKQEGKFQTLSNTIARGENHFLDKENRQLILEKEKLRRNLQLMDDRVNNALIRIRLQESKIQYAKHEFEAVSYTHLTLPTTPYV